MMLVQLLKILSFMITSFFSWALGITAGLGYWGIVILMAVESSFIPFPSEVVVPPAAYLASRGQINVFLVVIAGTAGSIIGAVINYWLADYLGRPLVYRLAARPWARFLLITPEGLAKAEQYFLKNADSATLIGRLVPAIRQLVSLPAGFCRMPFWRFLALTTLGSFFWVSILAALGYFIGSNQALLALYYREISLGLAVIGLTWIAVKVYQARQPSAK